MRHHNTTQHTSPHSALRHVLHHTLCASVCAIALLSLSVFGVGVGGGLHAAPHAAHSLQQDEDHSSIAPDVLGFRALYGTTTLSAQDAGPHGRHERLYGSAIALEWVLFHHHLEVELIGGAFEHAGRFDEFGELVFKAPINLSANAQLLFGVGGIVETHHQNPELGFTTDVNARYWLDQHWGLSAELDYVRLESGTSSVEWIAELLYRF